MTQQQAISSYSANLKSMDLLYIPKLNTDLFRDGNGLPIIRRNVHHIYYGNRYSKVGCDNTHEHSCPICELIPELYSKAKVVVDNQIEEARENWDSTDLDKLIQLEKDTKLNEYRDIPKRVSRVYIAVAEVFGYSMGRPTFQLRLLEMSMGVYIRDFKDLLFSSDDGVYIQIFYPGSDSIIEQVQQRKVSLYEGNKGCIKEMERRVLKEFKSLHRLDLEAIKPELGITSYDRAADIARLLNIKNGGSL